MQDIVHHCSETCHIGELQGRDVQYLMKVESPEPIGMVSAGEAVAGELHGPGEGPFV